MSGDRFKTTSTTTYTLQVPGNPGTLTVDPGLAYTVAQSIIIAYDANNHNEAEVTSYNSITGVINFVTFTLTGSGTYSSWFVNIDGASGGDGSSGSSGTSGTSATAGTSGTTGTSGSSGTSGTTGTSGSSGTSGTSATNGTGGTSGTSGSSGTSGTTGTSGTSATSGTSGTSATSGTTGTSGTSGVSGTGGSSGTSGSSATSGTSGTSGVNGAPGAGGTSGTSGTSVAVSGTTNTMAKFTSATTIGNSLLTDDGSTLSYVNNAQFLNGKTYTLNNGSGTSFEWYVRPDNNTTYVWRHIYGGSGTGFGTGVGGYGIYPQHLGGDYSAIFNTAGFVTFPYSARSPIFYDSDNTGYYLDPASTSNLNQVNLQGFLRRNTSAAGYLEGNYGASTTGNSSAAIYTIGGSYQPGTNSLGNMYGVGYTVGDGTSNPGLGQTGWGLYVASGGTSRIFLDSDSGVGISTNSWRAPIFYDSNNTAYYVDPAGASRMNSITYDNLYFSGDATYGFLGRNVYADTVNGRGSDPLELNYYDGGSVIIGTGANGSKALYAGSLYDSGNRVYSAANPQVNISGNAATATGQQSSTNFTINTGGAGYGLVGVYNPSVYQGLFAMGPAYVLGAGGTLGTLYGLAWTYDSAGYPLNTGYSTQHCLAVANNGTVYSLIGQGIWTSGLIRGNGIISTAASMRAPIFYDSDDTSYYLNPNGLSYLYSLELSGSAYFRPRTWIQLDGAYGIYWPNNNGAHIYPNTSSYTQLRLDGSKNGYGGIWDSYSGVAGIMYDSTGNGGVYREANGRWYFYYYYPNDCMGIGTSSTSSTYSLYLTKGVFAQSRIDATIYYDTNNTAYYLDPASGSYLNGISTTNYLTASNCALAVTGIAGQITLTTSTGFGGYFRATEHIVIENTSGGYHVYVLDSSGIGVVKYNGAQSWSAHSDVRIKTVHSTLENNLSKLENITPIYYSFNNFDDDRNRIGLIAQEVQQHFPELVNVDPKTDYLTLDYTGLIPVLLGAIKELKHKVETLETKI